MISYGQQHITLNDIEAVAGGGDSDFPTQGAKVPEFQQVMADKVGAKRSVRNNSEISSLHIACLSLALDPGDILAQCFRVVYDILMLINQCL